MDIPFKAITATSAVSSIVLVGFKPELLLFSRPSYLGTFLQIWTAFFCCWAFWIVILYPKFFSPLRKFPMPPGGSWWNGQFKIIKAQATGTPMIDWINNVPNDGIMRYLGMFNSERLLITGPKGLSEVLTTKTYDFVKPRHVVTGLGRLLGVGVLLAEGEEHKTQRRNLMPAFAFRHVKDLYPVFWNKACEAVITMTSHVDDGGIPNEALPDVHKRPKSERDAAVISIPDWASRATLDIIGLAGMGQDFGAIADPDTPLNHTYRKVFKPSRAAAILGLLNVFLPSWFVRNLPVERNGEIEAAALVIRSTCRRLIREKKEELEKHERTDIDILSVAIESGGFTEENLIDQMMTFLAAGHETTATAMTWAIYMLCLNPNIQEKLRAEIHEKLPSPDSDDIVTNHEIDHMPYLNAVCSELLRYYPPVPLTLRDAAHDTTLLGHHVPKGTRVMLVPWAINKSIALWGPDAATFNPDRWLPSASNPHSANGGAQSNYAYLTFLHGARSCIGQRFATAEFACLLAAFVGRFEFELNDPREMDEKNIEIKGGVTARPAKGLFVKAKVVESW